MTKNSAIHEDGNLEKRGDRNVKKCRLREAHHPFSVLGSLRELLVPDQKLFDLQDGFFIFAASLEDAVPLHELAVNFRRGNANFGCFDCIIGHQFVTLVPTMLDSEIDQDSALREHFASWGFKNRHEASVEIFVPLRLQVQISLHVLELNFFRGKCIPGTRHKGTQVVAIDSEVILVCLGFWKVTGRVDEGLQGVKVFVGLHSSVKFFNI